jgi:hypothetical protein
MIEISTPPQDAAKRKATTANLSDSVFDIWSFLEQQGSIRL